MNDPVDYCAALARDFDRDRYLIGLCCPDALRRDLWPLWAFNHEIAKTREVVTQETLGLIRLQWWREALAACYEGRDPPKHEILAALRPVIRKHDLPRCAFEALLTAREFDLRGTPPENMGILEDYAAETTAPLNDLALKIIEPCSPPPPEAVRALSIGWALCGLLRAVPSRDKPGFSFLPTDLKEKEGNTERTVREAVARKAASLLEQCRGQSPYLDRSALLAGLYLKRLARLNYNARDPRMKGYPAVFLLKACLGRL